MDEVYGKSEGTWGIPVVPVTEYNRIAQTVDTVVVVSSLPADAAQHPKTLYIIVEE